MLTSFSRHDLKIFVSVAENASLAVAAQFYSNFVALLPDGHRQTVRTIFGTLKELTATDGFVRSAEELAIVFAPLVCPDMPTQRPGQWSGAIVAKTLTIVFDCFDDIVWHLTPPPSAQPPPSPSTPTRTTSGKISSRNLQAAAADSSSSGKSPKPKILPSPPNINCEVDTRKISVFCVQLA